MTHDWRSLLIMRSDGSGIAPKSIKNACLILKNEPKFAGLFAEEDGRIVLVRGAPWSRIGDSRFLRATDINAVQCELEYYGLEVSYSTTMGAIKSVAEEGVSE